MKGPSAAATRGIAYVIGTYPLLTTTFIDREIAMLRESGVDVEFSNWRGLVAPPGLPDADRAALADAVSAMRDTPEWRQVLAANGWRDAWLPGADFARFTAAENERVEHVLGELGLRTR